MELNRLDAAADALGLGGHEHIALVGGGGKTTLWHAIAAGLEGNVVMTTTTKMGTDQHQGLTWLIDPSDADVVESLRRDRRLIVWAKTMGQKAIGVTPERSDRLFELADHVVVEADGARRRPFKAPAQFEPVVPATTTCMVSVIGADALGRVIADQCHRPLRVAAVAGCSPYERLSPRHAATVLTSGRGALKAKPEGSRFVIAVTKVAAENSNLVVDLIDELRRTSPGTPTVAFADNA